MTISSIPLRLRLGCIADDFTGATDLAGELVKAGLRTALIVGSNDISVDPSAEAVVIALKSRVLPADQAVRQSLKVLADLRDRGVEHVFFKYCSTFDSTDDGNIGPVLEALGAEMGVALGIACPAFPLNGRTVYQGHLFVGSRLLSRSGMEHHPLNPMTEADLVQVLQRQSRAKVGLLSYDHIARGRTAERAAELVRDGCQIAIADAVDEASLDCLAAWCATQPLSSGASGLGAAIARRLSGGKPAQPALMPSVSGRRAIVAGSCSAATLNQIARAQAQIPSLRVSPGPNVLKETAQWLASQPSDRPVLVYASASPEELAEQRAQGRSAEGEAVELMLAEVAAMLCESDASAIIVAGGETSGAVLQRLGIDRLDVGPEIAPGVPWTAAELTNGRRISLALKSGNFGGPDFFLDAWNVLS